MSAPMTMTPKAPEELPKNSPAPAHPENAWLSATPKDLVALSTDEGEFIRDYFTDRLPPCPPHGPIIDRYGRPPAEHDPEPVLIALDLGDFATRKRMRDGPAN